MQVYIVLKSADNFCLALGRLVAVMYRFESLITIFTKKMFKFSKRVQKSRVFLSKDRIRELLALAFEICVHMSTCIAAFKSLGFLYF